MTHLVYATGRLLDLYMWNRRRFMSTRDLQMESDAIRRVVKAFAGALHWQIIVKDWITAMQQNNIRSIAFAACPMEVLNEVC